MNRLATPLFAAALALGAVAAHASMRVNAADLPHITNGGTGFIGLTASAGQPAMDTMHDWSRVSTAPYASQERGAPDTRAMGGHAMPAAAGMHRAWGTPD
jgi:hypothetical protein